jgi:hypothetical protein
MSSELLRQFIKRNANRLAGFALVPSLLTCGCESMSNTDKGVLAGGGIGAGTGALIGSATHHTGAGALIGGAVGALAGGLTGNAIDQSEKKQQERLAAATAQPASGPMTIDDVVRLVQTPVSDTIVINQIRTSRTVFNLTSEDIRTLKENGVSDVVVSEMQATANRYPRRIYTQAPVYERVYVVEPAPPPPPVGIGVGIGFHGR